MPPSAAHPRARASYDVPERRHPSTWLPFSYHRLPGRLRFWLSRALMGGARDPAAVSAAVAFHADDEAGPCASPVWPRGARVAVALSHDVDTARGVSQVEPLLDLEERLASSTVFLPGDVADRHARQVRAWQARGFEVALHDVCHDNRLPHLAGTALARRLERIAATAAEFGMTGFRAPSLWIREATLLALPLPIHYDSSVPSHRPATRFAPARGASTCRPFRIGRLWELPVSMPLDDDLLRDGVGRDGAAAALGMWVSEVAARGGVAVYADHLEPHLSGNPPGRAAYQRFVSQQLADPGAWLAPLGAIVRHLDT